MRTLVVAMTPGGREGDPILRPLEGSQTKRRVDSMIHGDLFDFATVVNLLSDRVAAWDRVRAQQRAWVIIDQADLRYDRVLLLGAVTRNAFGHWVPGLKDWFVPATWRGITYTASPHPSGRSRWWNDPENRRGAERFYFRYFAL